MYFYNLQVVAGAGRPAGRHPAGRPEWCGEDWEPKDIPFTAELGPHSGAAAEPVEFFELFLTYKFTLFRCILFV